MVEKIKIVGLGFCGLDYLNIVPRIPVDDKVEIIEGLIQGGGPAATAIFTAQRLGAQTAFVGAVGDDQRGKSIIDELEREGVECRAIKCRSAKVSPAAFCWVEQSTGKRSIAWTRGSANPLTPDEVDVPLIKQSSLLHLDGHHTQAALAAARVARENAVKVVIDAGTILPGIDELLRNTDVIIASENFAHTYTGKADTIDALRTLFDCAGQWTVITRGDKGCMGFDGQSVIDVPAFNVNVIDTTGAGDVFHGGFIYKHLESNNLTEIMEFASAAAAMKCTKFGGRTGIPDLETVETFLEQR